MVNLLAYFLPGHLEVLIIGLVILLLFGHRLPSLMRSLGRGVVEFKEGLHGGAEEDEVADEPKVTKQKAKSQD